MGAAGDGRPPLRGTLLLGAATPGDAPQRHDRSASTPESALLPGLAASVASWPVGDRGVDRVKRRDQKLHVEPALTQVDGEPTQLLDPRSTAVRVGSDEAVDCDDGRAAVTSGPFLFPGTMATVRRAEPRQRSARPSPGSTNRTTRTPRAAARAAGYQRGLSRGRFARSTQPSLEAGPHQAPTARPSRLAASFQQLVAPPSTGRADVVAPAPDRALLAEPCCWSRTPPPRPNATVRCSTLKPIATSSHTSCTAASDVSVGLGSTRARGGAATPDSCCQRLALTIVSCAGAVRVGPGRFAELCASRLGRAVLASATAASPRCLVLRPT